jgi:WhiB family redox-sensing transcriptional regulator
MTELLDLRPPAWHKSAACVDTPPEVFFPDTGGDPTEALNICKSCPVQVRCLTWALEIEAAHPGSRWGVYGNTTARQRRTIAERAKKAS